MNIFVTSSCPLESARCLPDRHIVKMPIECCQMLSIIASFWYHNYGPLHKANGARYRVCAGAFRNHPCTIWAASSPDNAQWLIQWGLHLCDEYTLRFNGKVHSCHATLLQARSIFPQGNIHNVTPFVRAMPDEYKLDTSIDTFEAYKRFITSKRWPRFNYLRLPSRKPAWLN